MENSMEVLQKIYNRNTIRPSNSISGYMSKGNENRIFTHRFAGALFTIAKIWKQPNCLSLDEGIKKWDVHTHCSATRTEILPFRITWIDLEGILPSEVNLIERQTLHHITYMWNLKSQTYRHGEQNVFLPEAGGSRLETYQTKGINL